MLSIGIISALKKRYKYLYLRDVLEFTELDDTPKEHKWAQGQRLSRGAKGVAYGNPVHLLDAAHYVKCVWNSVTHTTISSSFKKVDIMMTLPNEINKEDELIDLFANLMPNFGPLNIKIETDELDKFVHANDENNLEFTKAILEDVDDLLNAEDADDINKNNDDSSATQADEEQVNFVGFDDLYDALLDFEYQLLYQDVQHEAGGAYDELIAFHHFKLNYEP